MQNRNAFHGRDTKLLHKSNEFEKVEVKIQADFYRQNVL